MELKWMLLVLLSLTGQQLSQAADECPDLEDAIPSATVVETDTESQAIRQTQYLMDNEDDAEELAKVLTMENISRAFASIPDAIKKVGDEKPGLAAAQDIAIPYYYRTCPYRWYVMRPYRWYWRLWELRNGISTKRYCFSYWWVWATFCPRCPCHNHYYPFQQWWDPRFLCFPEYRIMWLPMVCYRSKITSGVPEKSWSSWKWRRVYVPYGCCCRRYWYWLSVSAAKCPAVTSAAPT